MAFLSYGRHPAVVVVCFFFCLAIPGTRSFEWIASPNFPDDGHVSGCRGHDLELLWGYRLGADERHVDTEWYFQLNSSLSGVPLATLVGQQDTVQVMSQAPFQVTYANNSQWNAAIVLPNITAGRYTVVVNVEHSQSVIFIGEQQSITVSVVDPPDAPTLRGADLQAELDSATVADAATNTAHLRLSCGAFSNLGNPPVNVMWRTPDNVTLNSTDYDTHTGLFVLDLNTSLPNGDYSCFVEQTASSPLACQQPGIDNMHAEVHVTFDQASFQFQQLQAQMTQLAQQNAMFSLLMNNLTQELSSLRAENDRLREKDANLTEQLNTAGGALAQHTDMQDFVRLPQNCGDVQTYNTTDGQHTLFTRGYVYHAYCDQTTEGGGWTVIQRRVDGTENFYRGWKDYENGFGDVTAEHWLGLEKLYLLTSSGDYQLRVDLEDFGGSRAFAVYSNFSVDNADSNYTLHVSDYNGTAGNSLRLNDNYPFTTRDRDNDISRYGNCAVDYKGGFWYGDCSGANLNGQYKQAAEAGAAGNDAVYWFDWKSSTQSLKTVVMMVKAV